MKSEISNTQVANLYFDNKKREQIYYYLYYIENYYT